MLKAFAPVSALMAAILTLMFVGLPAASAGTVAPLITAAKSGNTASLKTLLHHGASPNTHDATGISALEWAAAKGHLDEVIALLKAHAAVDGSNTPLKFTPLMRAAYFGFSQVAAALNAHGAHVNAHTTTGATALDYAILSKRANVVALLKRHGAKTGVALGPQILCNAGGSAGFDEYPAWMVANKSGSAYFCQSIKHDFPPGTGNIVMYTYEIDGTTTTAKSVYIETDMYTTSIPTEMIAQTLRPLLEHVYATGHNGPIPTDLLNTLTSLTNIRRDTAFGLVTGVFTYGSHINHPTIGASYIIRITLH